MDEQIVALLLQVSARLGLPVRKIAYGAGHDAAVFAPGGIPTGIIFVRDANGLPNPNEDMDMGDFMLGVELMVSFVTSGDRAYAAVSQG